MTKPYHEMTPAERLAARIAKNREIEQRVVNSPAPVEKAKRRGKAAEPTLRARTPNNPLDKFHEIKRTMGIDAASEYLEARRNQPVS